MTGAVVRSSFESYLVSGTNRFWSEGNAWAGRADDGIGKLTQHGAQIVCEVSKLYGHNETAQKCQAVANGVGDFRFGVGAFRAFFPVHKFVTGQMFWQTDSQGWRRVKANDAGKAIVIPRDELNTDWVKQRDGSNVWLNIESGQISTDGKYIDDTTEHWVYAKRDWMDIIMDICVLVARILTPIRWLHALKAIDLGKHAQWLGGVVTALWGFVLTVGFVQSIRDLINEVDFEAIRRKIWDTFQAFIDWIAIPFDFGIGSSHPILAIVGAGLNVLSAGSMLAKDAAYYGS